MLSKAHIPAQNHNLTQNGQSRSFKVIYFKIIESKWGITYKSGLITKVSKAIAIAIAIHRIENRPSRLSHYRLMHPLQRTAWNYRVKVIGRYFTLI